MPEDKQWFWTKLVGSLLTLFLVISIAVGVANMHYALRNDVIENRNTIVKHEASDVKQWDKAWEQIDENTDDIHLIEIQNSSIQTMLTQILSRLDKAEANDQRIIDMLNRFEVIEDGM